MPSSLIPERPLLISPTLAATIGLEEAVMLHVISELQQKHQTVFRNQRNWFHLSQEVLLHSLPFWNEKDVSRIQHNLFAKGLLLKESLDRTTAEVIAINQPADPPSGPAPSDVSLQSFSNSSAQPATHSSHPSSHSAAQASAQAAARAPEPAAADSPQQNVFSRKTGSTGGGATPISPFWQPGNDLYQICEQQHKIPRKFIAERVKGFVMFQRERGNTQYSWHNTFQKWIIREWREEQSYQGAKELEGHMSSQWAPSEDATEILEHAGVPADFIEDAVPEFVLYWRERGLVTSTWNTKFIAHVRRQWAKYSAEVPHDSTPHVIPDDFEPSAACFEILALANIDFDFALNQIHEFVLYWRERGEACSSWNSRFLQHVKYKWASRPQSGLPASKQLEHTIARMTDRSWAD